MGFPEKSIFICYRRSDAPATVGRIYDRLTAHFGRGTVFRDVDSIPIGTDFRQHIRECLEGGRVGIVVIGPRWDAERLAEPNDFVRLEIETMLRHPRLHVFPLYVDGAKTIRSADLPTSIAELGLKHAAFVRHDPDFHPDVERVLRAMETMQRKPGGARRRLAIPLLLVFLALLIFGGGWWAFHRDWGKGSNPENEGKAVVPTPTPEPEIAVARPESHEENLPLAIPEPTKPTIATATKEAPFVNTLGMKFVPVAITGEAVARTVYFSIWETRVRDLEAFVKEDGYDMSKGEPAFTLERDGKGGYEWKQAGGDWQDPHFPASVGYRGAASEHPVVCVSFKDAQAFCTWLTRREHAADRLPADWSYRLPTDKEWSQAVGLRESSSPRMDKILGKATAEIYPWSGALPAPFDAKRMDGNYRGEESRTDPKGIGTDWPVIDGYNDTYSRTAPVGSFRPNMKGIYDLGGNVWEWCTDHWRDGGIYLPVARGASWDDQARHRLLSTYRDDEIPFYRRANVGFRCVVSGATP